MNVDNWDDLRIFLATVRAGSVAAAARTLGVDPTTVARRMSAFEDSIDKKLFDRLRGGVLLSPEGQAVFEGAEATEAAVRNLERRTSQHDTDIRGDVRVAIPEMLAIAWTRPILKLAGAHPGLSVQLVAGDAMHNLSRREADVAVRVTQTPPAHLVGKKVAQLAIAAYGTPDLVQIGLTHAPWLGWTGLNETESFIGRMRTELGAQGPYALHVNNYGILMEALRAGAGVTTLPCALGEAIPELVCMSPPELIPQPMWILTHPDLQESPRIRYVMDALYDLVETHRNPLEGRS